ncbi:MAG: hypothetical protein AAF927_25065 [Bacteroidota bacterium]
MSTTQLTSKEKESIIALYGKPLEELEQAEFEKTHKGLRAKFHPDKFEQYDDEVVREMAKEKFQILESLGQKIRAHFEAGGGQKVIIEDEFGEAAVFAYDNMKIEILTRNKDLKYHLFGSRLRWLERGERFKIPKTGAYLIVETEHRGMSIGFTESVKIYLTFGPEDDLAEITVWLYERLRGQAEALIIEGKRLAVNLNEMLGVIRKKSFLRLGD